MGNVVVINTHLWPREGKREAVEKGLARGRRPVRVREGQEVVIGIVECSAGLWGGPQDVAGQHRDEGRCTAEDAGTGRYSGGVGAVAEDVPGVCNLCGAKRACSAMSNATKMLACATLFDDPGGSAWHRRQGGQSG